MLAENNKVISSKIQEALDKFREALLTHCADQVERMILFGSQATGEAAAESDIDTLVVVNWETERLPGGFYASLCGDPRWRRIVELAYDISLEHNVYHFVPGDERTRVLLLVSPGQPYQKRRYRAMAQKYELINAYLSLADEKLVVAHELLAAEITTTMLSPGLIMRCFMPLKPYFWR